MKKILLAAVLGFALMVVAPAQAQMTTADRLYNRTSFSVSDRMFVIGGIYFPPPVGYYTLAYSWVRNCRNVASGLAYCDWSGIIRRSTSASTVHNGTIIYREDGISMYRNGVYTENAAIR